MNREDKIVQIAKRYIGQTEIKGNQGFHDKDFEKKMRSIGFQSGHAWCAYFSELVWREAYADDQKISKILENLFSGSSYRTLVNFNKAGYKAEKEARVGSIVIWRRKKNGAYTTLGHVGVVTKVERDYFESIEGNTNAAGSREGDVVAHKQRKYDWSKDNGLELAGFIHPIGEIKMIPDLPFKNSEEGNKFRGWVNDNYPDIAKEIDLDREGSFNNKFIREAWERLYEKY